MKIDIETSPLRYVVHDQTAYRVRGNTAEHIWTDKGWKPFTADHEERFKVGFYGRPVTLEEAKRY